jgi:hypothetical protein
MLTNNEKAMPLHGPYTPQAGGLLTDEIDTAEHFKKKKMVRDGSHVHEIWTSLPPPRDVHISRT